MKRNLLFIPFILFLSLIVFLGWQLMKNMEGSDPTRLESALIGKPVPELHIGTLEDPQQHMDLNLFADGQPWLINYWATWCPTCRAEHDYLKVLAKQGVRIAGINYKDQRNQALEWLRSLGSPYSINLYDPSGSTAFDFGVYGAPETFLVDGKGIIRYRYTGNLTPEVWRREIAPLWKHYQREVKS
ncbi:DsbE family thiol:disulfide interchange protein [Scandinavium sp. NPDC088450]|uniref:DsbE family thiol:disulfide interchange protein n=1 Tax=Scandinavium sp. NPDC088450 TaxID=3364514 RepID=UPI00384D3657